MQDPDLKEIKERDLKFVTDAKPTKKQIKDLLFAWKICRVSKSNAIVLVKDEILISSGVGQQDRKRCCKLAIIKADRNANPTGISSRSYGARNTVAASDGFFPFTDGPAVLFKAGVKAVIEPGGSIKDNDVIKFFNKHKIPLVFTGIRCFKH